jgi:hypothetical protein
MLKYEVLMDRYKDAITARRNAVLRDWHSFVAGRSPFVISEVIERTNTDLPDDFVPWAVGVVTPSAYLLEQVGPHWGPWECTAPDVYQALFCRNKLMVRGCGELWTVERQIDEVLVYSFGSLPVFTRTREAAMQLAEYCHALLPHGLGGLAQALRWVVSTPDGIQWC